MKVAGWSEAHYVDLMPHNPLGPICTAATAHCAAAVAEFRLAGDPRLADRGPRLRRRRVLPGAAAASTVRGYRSPTRPGLGVEVNESKLSAVPAEMWNPPQLHRRDGSVQNWVI